MKGLNDVLAEANVKSVLRRLLKSYDEDVAIALQMEIGELRKEG